MGFHLEQVGVLSLYFRCAQGKRQPEMMSTQSPRAGVHGSFSHNGQTLEATEMPCSM